MFPVRDATQAACAPGSITPITGTFSICPLIVGNPTEDAVLHAMTRHLTPYSASACAACSEYRATVSGLFVPYGRRAVSPRYTKFSCGNLAVRALRTVRPPTPESNTPMGCDACGARVDPRGATLGRGERAERAQLLNHSVSGRICGNRMTSRIDGESVKNITSRSIPTPRPAVGGIPYSNARM
jgi:hypothetical protein